MGEAKGMARKVGEREREVASVALPPTSSFFLRSPFNAQSSLFLASQRTEAKRDEQNRSGQ